MTSENTTRVVGFLAQKNHHERDERITFIEEDHKYIIKGLDKNPISVTTLIHCNFPTFNDDLVIDKMMNSKNWKSSKYYGKTKDEIKNEWKQSGKIASEAGTIMHADIERFFNHEPVLNPNSKEFSHFNLFWNEFQKVNPSFFPYRTEWVVYDEDNGVAGSIDCVLSNPQGQLVILDWKRSKEIKMENKFEKGLGLFNHLDNCNFWHYSLQLNIYRYILETKYNKQVVDMFIVVLHPDNPHFLIHKISPYDISSIWKELTSKTEVHS